MKLAHCSRSCWLRIALLMTCSIVSLAIGEVGPLKILNKWDMKSDGRWDYIVPDSAAGRVYVARTTRFMVLDINSGKLIGEVPSAPNAHGIALAKDLGVGFTSDGGSNTSTVFDLKTLKVETRIPVGNNPDAISYDPATQRVFVNNRDSEDVTVIDAVKRNVIGSIKMPGKPEFAVNDGKGSIYINIDGAPGKVAQFDTTSMKIKNAFSLGACEGPAGLGMDKHKRILFSGCSNGQLAIVNADSGKVLQVLPIGEDADGVFFDYKFGQVYVSTGADGKIVVVGENAGKYAILQTLPTTEGSKTMGLDLETHKLYVPTAKFGPLPLERSVPQ
ncbi:MAG: YncE family protein [Terriglobales bacterium]